MNRPLIIAALLLLAGCKGSNPATEAVDSYHGDVRQAQDAVTAANKAIAASPANKDAADNAAQ